MLKRIDLELRQGEVVLLRGENGSGKTTLLNILTGNIESDAGGIDYLADGTPRSYSFPRRWWQELNPFDHFTPEFVAQEGIGRTWQDVRLFGSQSLRDNIAVAEPGHPGENPLVALIAPGRANRREAELNQIADTMLGRLGLAGRESSSGNMISLGQSKRVAIARAVAAGAKVLFLDEPLAGLDQQGISDVLSLLESLVRDHELTLVIVEHVFNQPHLHGMVTTDWLLESGSLHRNGAASGQSQIVDPKSKIVQRPAWFHLLAGDDAEIIDEPLPRGAILTRIRRRGRLQSPPKKVLEIHNLVVKRGPRSVIGLDNERNLTGFNLALYEGEMVILQAPNGWGKSSLFAAICGTIRIEAGSINLKGQALEQLPTWERIGLGLCALPSDGHTFPGLSASETLTLVGNENDATELGDLADRASSSLSGGQKQRLALLSMKKPESVALRIFDEPFSMLDFATILQAATTLQPTGQSSTFIALPSYSH